MQFEIARRAQAKSHVILSLELWSLHHWNTDLHSLFIHFIYSLSNVWGPLAKFQRKVLCWASVIFPRMGNSYLGFHEMHSSVREDSQSDNLKTRHHYL